MPILVSLSGPILPNRFGNRGSKDGSCQYKTTNLLNMNAAPRKLREVWARQDDMNLVVYQAFGPEIALPALREQKLIAPFSLSRMTWVKPSFLWACYRSEWATAKQQQRLLAITLAKSIFFNCLDDACLSHFEPEVHKTSEVWSEQLRTSACRIQWDPERDVNMVRMEYRSLQLGIGSSLSKQYAESWITCVEDVTALAHQIRDLIRTGQSYEASKLLPKEQLLSLPRHAAERIGSSVS